MKSFVFLNPGFKSGCLVDNERYFSLLRFNGDAGHNLSR